MNKLVFLLCFFASLASAQKGQFLTLEQFHQQAFVGTDAAEELPWQTLWVTAEQRAVAADILDHSFTGLRVRYRVQGQRTAWTFEEIGKELPITIGVVVEGGEIQLLRILAFRESRGGEVRYPFFTDQFVAQQLHGDNENYELSGNIDGISGATLSVWAVKKVAKLALYFHSQTPYGQAQP